VMRFITVVRFAPTQAKKVLSFIIII
jgi:hypothetical protein